MNDRHDESMAECHRRQILQEAEQSRLEKLAREARLSRPRLFGWVMFKLANWMISTGQQLRKHYEISQEEGWIRPHTKATL